MHVEKNVCDSLIGTLLNIKGKTKDGVNARLDLIEMNTREELAPREVGKRTYLPAACYTLSKKEKTSCCECLKGDKVVEDGCCPFKIVFDEDFYVHFMCILLCFKCVLGSA